MYQFLRSILPSTLFKCSADGSYCDEGEYECQRGECISSDWVCDGMEDCLVGDDEFNCSPSANGTTTTDNSKSGVNIGSYFCERVELKNQTL